MLVLVNGPPGVGKSVLARRLVAERELALLVEIDLLRMSLGGWARNAASRSAARDLAVALAHAHLRSGHDVVVPQFVGRPDLVRRLSATASVHETPFVHLVLRDEESAIIERFRERRGRLTAGGVLHPEADVPEAAVVALVADATRRLEAFEGTRVLDPPHDVTWEQLEA